MNNKDKKYCIFCRTENDIKNTVCCNKKCKRKFLDEYNDLKYLVIDYYKGDFKGNLFDIFTKLLSYFLNTWLYGIIVVVSIVAAVSEVAQALDKPDKHLTTNTPQKIMASKEKVLDNDNEVISKLLVLTRPYENEISHTDYTKGLYKDKSYKISDLEDSSKFALAAYHYGYGKVQSVSDSHASKDCVGLNDYETKRCNDFKEVTGLTDYYYHDLVFTKDMMREGYKSLYNEDVSNFKSFENGIMNCTYENGDYHCTESNEYKRHAFPNQTLVGARTYENRVELDIAYSVCYDGAEGENRKCYTPDSNKVFVCEENMTDINASEEYKYKSDLKGLKYTFIFKKIDDNYVLDEVINTKEYYRGDIFKLK